MCLQDWHSEDVSNDALVRAGVRVNPRVLWFCHICLAMDWYCFKIQAVANVIPASGTAQMQRIVFALMIMLQTVP